LWMMANIGHHPPWPSSLAIIQIVNLRASSTPVNNKDQPGT
jgi:hypothetical protein